MGLSDNVIYRMHCIPKKSSKVLIREVDRELGHLGLRSYHIMVISLIGFEPDTTQKKIIERTFFTKARVSNIVAELLDEGYVVNMSSGKTSSLRLTEKGESVFEVSKRIYDRSNTEVISALTDEESTIFGKLLDKLDARLNDMIAQGRK